MFMDCTAAPAVPLTRLSIAVTVTTRPAAWSTATWTSAVFAPRVIAVVGHCPADSTRTNGSPTYASSQAWRTRASRAAGSRRAASSDRRAVTVARMPRDMGTSVGVNEMLTAGAPAARRFCAISGMCRCDPPTAYGCADPSASDASRCGLSDFPAPEYPLASTATRSVPSTSPSATPGWMPSVTAVTLHPGTATRRAPASRSRCRVSVAAAPAACVSRSSGSPYGHVPACSEP